MPICAMNRISVSSTRMTASHCDLCMAETPSEPSTMSNSISWVSSNLIFSQMSPYLLFYYPGVRSHQSQESVTETEPPAYSDLYSRDNSQLDRLVVSD